MKKRFFAAMLCLLIHSHTLAVKPSSTENLVSRVKSFINDIIHQVQEQLGLDQAHSHNSGIEMPVIPQPKNNPLDLNVYKKRMMTLYPGTRKYSELSNQKKKKQSLGFILEIYRVTQLREPSRREINDWLNGLLQGGSREGVYRGVVYSDDYRRLEAQQLFTTQDTLDFSVNYLKNYLEKKAKADLLRKLDIYSLKKIIVKTTLKTLEAMSDKPDDLMRWYAIFSADIASQYPDIWEYQLRANKSDEAHYQWAQQAAYQQIIAEVIVKLHKTLNHLGKLRLD